MEEKRHYENLQKPIKIGSKFIKNRIALAPMGDIYQVFDMQTGVVNQNWVDYLAERAKGEVGLLIPTAMKVADDILTYREYGLCDWVTFNHASMRVYNEIAQYAHAYGAAIFFQLSAGRGRVARPDAFDDERFIPVSASDNEGVFRPDKRCRPITGDEIKKIIKSFGEAAKILVKAGIDGVELHAHEGYLLDEFATSLWNKRTDKYGGNLEQRLTFAKEILYEIKDKAGSDFPVTYRFGVKHFIKSPLKSALRIGEPEIGRDVDESIELAKILEREGFDGLHLDVGCYESVYWSHPPTYQPWGCASELTAKVKQAVKIPCIVAGKVGIPQLAEKLIAEGKADMVALGRPLLADPYWAKKAFEGREEDITPCIGCHEEMYKSEMYQFTTCAVNPFCANERNFSLQPAERKKKVLIAGGGVGGMEAASIATLRGHDVTIYEKTNKLGGHLIEASAPSFKEDIGKLLNYYNTRLGKLKIKVKYGNAVTPELVEKENPDTVIIATGSSPIIPRIPGVDKPHVVTCIDVFLNKKQVGDNVIVIGGGLEGCEMAAWLSQKKKKVTLIEQLPNLVTNIHRANRVMLMDMLEDGKVNILTKTTAKEITSKSVICSAEDGSTLELFADSVILAVGLKPERQLYDALVGKSRDVYQIGDCKEPRKIGDAIWEGCMLALHI
jgi:2-enoate reductase